MGEQLENEKEKNENRIFSLKLYGKTIVSFSQKDWDEGLRYLRRNKEMDRIIKKHQLDLTFRLN